MPDVIINGHTYNEAMFTSNGGYGYRDPHPVTGLPLFPESIFTDMLADAAARSYDISVSIPGNPYESEAVLRFVAVRAFSLPALLVNSKLSAAVAATAQYVFSVKKNGVEVGTITVAAAGTTATFAGAGASFAIGDVLTIVGAAIRDPTLADIAITLTGSPT